MFSRYEQINGAVTRAGVKRWIAIDDDTDFDWPISDFPLVRCDPNQGLGSLSTQEELRSKLAQLSLCESSSSLNWH
ncbi:hypothetical protein ACF8Q9_08190 [Pseudomonas sp. TYF_15]|uniref:hypothetical protein n=1 Tax=Pseudomonas sp. TYF_15 TaxID=3367194 RepID=UPI00370C5B02